MECTSVLRLYTYIFLTLHWSLFGFILFLFFCNFTTSWLSTNIIHITVSDEGKGSDEEEDDENVKISKDGEDDMLADDGNIILPDCCCLICHK